MGCRCGPPSSHHCPVGSSFYDATVELRLAFIDLLCLRDCRFDVGTAKKPTWEMRCFGRIVLGRSAWAGNYVGSLPGCEVALPILHRGRTVGHMVLVPTPGEPVSLERRLFAMVLTE